MSVARVTITLPADVVRTIDGLVSNRSKFFLEAVERELRRRRRAELRRSLAAPHGESAQMAEAGFAAWADSLLDEGGDDLVDPDSGTPVQWVAGHGWERASERR